MPAGSADSRDGLDLHASARGQCGDPHRRPGGWFRTHVARVDGVHRLEVGKVDEEHGRLHDALPAAARRLEDRLQVLAHLLGLLLDPGADDTGAPDLYGYLPGDEDEVAHADRLRIRGTLERRGRALGADDGLLSHRSPLSCGRWLLPAQPRAP